MQTTGPIKTGRTGAAVLLAAVPAFLAMAGIAMAQDAAPAAPAPTPTLNAGDTAWMLTSTALVLMMTIPGLALFYGGMVRKKNVLSVVMQSFAITCLVSILWMIAGYSLAFTDGGSANAYIGSLSKAFFSGVTMDSLTGTIPEYVFITFQMTFAIITPALIGGAKDQMISSVIAYYATGAANWGMAGALGIVLLAATMILYVVYLRLSSEEVRT